MNADGSIKHLIPEGGYIDETRSDKNSYTLRAQINFNRTFDEKHEVSAIAGGERRAVHSTSTYVEKYGYDKVSLAHKYLDEATLNQTQQGTEAINNSYTHVPNGYPDTFGDKEDRYVSFYGNASYTYDRRYAITGSIRMDQSNLFGTNPKYQYKPLWSVGVSWHMAQEKFMGNMDWLDQLSIRFTKGINGNIAKQSGPYMIVYSAGIIPGPVNIPVPYPVLQTPAYAGKEPTRPIWVSTSASLTTVWEDRSTIMRKILRICWGRSLQTRLPVGVL